MKPTAQRMLEIRAEIVRPACFLTGGLLLLVAIALAALDTRLPNHGRLTPIPTDTHKNGSGAHGRLGAVTAYPTGMATGGDRAPIQRGRGTVPRQAHNLEVAGSTPACATASGLVADYRCRDRAPEERRRGLLAALGLARVGFRALQDGGRPLATASAPRAAKSSDPQAERSARRAMGANPIRSTERARAQSGPNGFDVESKERRACERRSNRSDQASTPNCEYERNRRSCVSSLRRRWASCPSSLAASAHGLAGSNPASDQRDLAGGGGADPLASMAVEASQPYLGQACARRRLGRFADLGSIPSGSTDCAAPIGRGHLLASEGESACQQACPASIDSDAPESVTGDTPVVYTSGEARAMRARDAVGGVA